VGSKDFGEQVVGSRERATFHAPWNLDGTPAIASFNVQGAAFTLASAPTLTLPPSSSLSPDDLTNIEKNSPIVVFEPLARGSYDGVLTIQVTWADGHVEVQRIPLHGRARDISDAPALATAPLQAADATQEHERKRDDEAMAKEARRTDPLPNNIEVSFSGENGIVSKIKGSASYLATKQLDGMGIVEKEAANFKKIVRHADPSMWWDLVEIALDIGTAGVAGHLAGKLLPALLANAKPGKDAAFSKFTTDALKEGLKLAGKAAIAAAKRERHGESHAQTQDGGWGHSADKEIDFFAEQRAILERQAHENSDLFGDRMAHLRPLLRTDPHAVMTLLDTMHRELENAAEPAEQIQADATAPQWTSYVVRQRLGTEDVQRGDARLLASRTQMLRPGKLDGIPQPVDGVLDIMLVSARPPIGVTGARMHGVGWAVAMRLRNMNLSRVSMPIRLVLGSGDHTPTLVTRDEVGRIGVAGDLEALAKYDPNASGAGTETEAVAGAAVLVEQVLSRPLAQWGVDIQTNDANRDGGEDSP
jgi:hypothetical protein